MSDITAAEPGPPAGAPKPGPSARTPDRTPARSSGRRRLAALEPLLWIGPAIALIAVVVLWPIVTMVQTSFQNITPLGITRSEEHTSELQSRRDLVCRLL